MKRVRFGLAGCGLALLCAAALAPVQADALTTSGCFGARGGVAFFDNFSSASALKPWKAMTGRYANDVGSPQLQWYTPQAVTVSRRHLKITAERAGQGYHSGRVSTQSSCHLLYGSIQARIWTPAGQGLWPAFWLVDKGDHHEIDVMESLGERPTLYYAGVHVGGVADMHSASGQFANSWHVYGVLWTATGVTFTVDGHPFCSRPDAIDKPLYMVLNLAIGGWAGPPDASTPFPAPMKVDWVKAYKLGHQPPLLAPTPQQCQLES